MDVMDFMDFTDFIDFIDFMDFMDFMDLIEFIDFIIFDGSTQHTPLCTFQASISFFAELDFGYSRLDEMELHGTTLAAVNTSLFARLSFLAYADLIGTLCQAHLAA